MELLTGDRQVPNSTDFPQHISPFPAAGNLLISNPMAEIHSSEIDRQNLPPQKLRPIRANGRSPSSSQASDLPLAGGLDGTLENLGLLADQVCGISGENGQYFKPPVKAEDSEMVLNGFADTGNPCLVADGSAGFGSGAGGEDGDPDGVRGLFEVKSSTSSDDDDSPAGITKEFASQKRKRKTREKLEDFLENLVLKVMEKQEQMHKQLIETMESRERERVIREEAWKQQERERMKREEELRAQENARNLALISFIQNVMGHKIEVPQALTTITPHAEKHGENDASNHSIQNDFKCDLSNRRWPEAEVQALIMLRTALEQKFRALGAKCSNVWDEISVGMCNMGYNRTAKKCKEKWENINKYFRKSMESGGKKRLENMCGKFF
ncbi:hypothetical protein MANES_07G124500v8 [Manihot esculenta]|uniref:Uncharacterized protein n=1 Tax=Manihot esculenta TaxID=3983 RepID=A0ACB7HFI0_MANES|nr:hypothetical protein MANES_07G124500v8 [Manihot esculenta]